MHLILILFINKIENAIENTSRLSTRTIFNSIFNLLKILFVSLSARENWKCYWKYFSSLVERETKSIFGTLFTRERNICEREIDNSIGITLCFLNTIGNTLFLRQRLFSIQYLREKDWKCYWKYSLSLSLREICNRIISLAERETKK